MKEASIDVVVIGGGPAGMMAACIAAEQGACVVLLEKNLILGKKLLITGGGRCNILHADFDTHSLVGKYGKKGKSLYSTFSLFDAEATWNFFENAGLKLKIEAEKRAFPVSDSAEDVQRTLLRILKKMNVEIRTGIEVKRIESNEGSIKKIVHTSGEIEAKKYILATGGKSRPETGSTGDGFVWAQTLGHTVVQPSVALVPVTVSDSWIKDVAGISLKDAQLNVWQDKKKCASKNGKMLFTHQGLSGPLVLNMSKNIGALLEEGEVIVTIDLYPKMDAGTLDRHMQKIFDDGKNKMMKNHIGDLVQPRLGQVLLTLAGIEPLTPLRQLTKEDRKKFGALLKGIPLTISGLLGTDKAVVTGGGVDLKEIEFKTMQSKKIKNLYFAGDILDFDRPSGGFSLQICWTTGFVSGRSAGLLH